jgi:hypothetical protein
MATHKLNPTHSIHTFRIEGSYKVLDIRLTRRVRIARPRQVDPYWRQRDWTRQPSGTDRHFRQDALRL